MKRALLYLLVLTLVPTLAMANVVVMSPDAAGVPTFAQGDLGQLPAEKALTGDFAADTLQGILMNHFGAFGDEEMRALPATKAINGDTVVRFEQFYNGLKVYGAGMVMRADQAGNIVYRHGGDQCGRA